MGAMLKLAKAAFLLLVASLPLMKHGAAIGGLTATPTELLFLVVAALWAAALLAGQTRFRSHRLWPFLLALLLATCLSAFVRDELARVWPRLAARTYLLALPLLAFNLVEDERDVRRALLAWLAGTAITAGVGVATLAGFAAGLGGPVLEYGRHGFGTLPPGAYPRLESTFTHPAMLCNYLTASLAVLLACRRNLWVGRGLFAVLLGGVLLSAAFTITPGLGGIILLLASWAWLEWRQEQRRRAMVALAGGTLAALAFVVAATVTPFVYPAAPFIVAVPGTSVELAGSVRVMAWLAAGASFLRHAMVGSGMGDDIFLVHYVAPSGMHHVLNDAHNVFLNVAAHNGLIGLAALLLLIGFVARKSRPWRLGDGNSISLLLGLAWLDAFVYQGLTGSYEDARHLWVLLGLFIAALRVEAQARTRSSADR